MLYTKKLLKLVADESFDAIHEGSKIWDFHKAQIEACYMLLPIIGNGYSEAQIVAALEEKAPRLARNDEWKQLFIENCKFYKRTYSYL